MLLAILILQTVSLIAIAVLAATGRLRGPQGPQGIPGPQGPKGDSAPGPAGVRSDLAQVLVYREGGWKHHGFAQIGSEAYRDALTRTGWAVLRPGEPDIDVGEQA